MTLLFIPFEHRMERRVARTEQTFGATSRPKTLDKEVSHADHSALAQYRIIAF